MQPIKSLDRSTNHSTSCWNHADAFERSGCSSSNATREIDWIESIGISAHLGLFFYRLVMASTGNALVSAAMHSNSTEIHNGARPNALNIANAVEINRSAKGRYTNSIGPVLSGGRQPAPNAG